MSENNWDEKITQRWFSYPNYEGALDLLKEHQQIRIYKFEVLVIVVILGILINTLSSYLVAFINSGFKFQNIKYILIFLVLIIIIIFYINKQLSKYKPTALYYEIQFSLHSLMLSDIKDEMEKKEFYKKDFNLWYNSFKNRIITLFKETPLLKQYEYKKENVKDTFEIREIILSSTSILSTTINVNTSPMEFSNKTKNQLYYYDINFTIRITVTQSGVPEAREYIDRIYAGTTSIMSKIENALIETFSDYK